jgi:hypothetical protein
VALDPVPWAISGSQLDTYVMREFAFMALQGARGVALTGHGKVTALGSPSGNVNVAAGGITTPNVQSTRGEQYVGQIASDTVLPIPPTSGSGRSDLIIATFIDPDYAPWQPSGSPGAPNTSTLFGPYFIPERIPCTSTTTKASQVVSYSAVELARIDIPASTTNITNAMITDLRKLARPRVAFAQGVQQGPGSQENVLVTDTTYKTFPSNTLAVTVPDWATNCLTEVKLENILADGSGDLLMRLNFGGLFSTDVAFDYNAPAGTPSNWTEGVPMSVFGDVDVRSLQGQTVVLGTQAKRTFTGNTGALYVRSTERVKFDLRFYEKAI